MIFENRFPFIEHSITIFLIIEANMARKLQRAGEKILY